MLRVVQCTSDGWPFTWLLLSWLLLKWKREFQLWACALIHLPSSGEHKLHHSVTFNLPHCSDLDFVYMCVKACVVVTCMCVYIMCDALWVDTVQLVLLFPHVSSCRGAPEWLVMLEDLQMLLDNFAPDSDLLRFRCCKKGTQLCVHITRLEPIILA